MISSKKDVRLGYNIIRPGPGVTRSVVFLQIVWWFIPFVWPHNTGREQILRILSHLARHAFELENRAGEHWFEIEGSEHIPSCHL